jgi:hypothetical protein
MADHLLAGAPADAAAERQKKQAQAQRRKEKRLQERLKAEAEEAEKIKQQKLRKSLYGKLYRERKAAEKAVGGSGAASGAAGGSGAASGAASQKRANTREECLEVGPGDPGAAGRYTVMRCTIVPRPPTGLPAIMDKPDLLELLLRNLTREEGKHLLARTCRQLAQSVRDENVPWKALTEFQFDSEYGPDMETVHDLFAEAFPFYRRDELRPFAAWLLEKFFRARVRLQDQWDVIFECIPTEGLEPVSDEKANHKPAEVTDAYKIWLAHPNRQWDVWDMKTLSDKIEKKCLEYISPSCWQSWETPAEWCPLVVDAFIFWERKLGFKLDLNKIHSWSILGRLDQEAFCSVKKKIDLLRRKYLIKNWNQFCFALLKECHNHYNMPEDEEWNDDYRDVRGDFERDEGADFEDPDYPE